MRVRYDWNEVQRYYDEGHGRDDCMAEVWVHADGVV